MKSKTQLWKCTSCGQSFVTRNMSHSCGDHTIEEHFKLTDPCVREIFDALVKEVEEFGPVHVYAQKSRIVFQTRGRFVAVTPRKRHLGGHLWLKRPHAHPLVHRIESLAGRDFIHNFRLGSVNDMDNAFRALLGEAYKVGSQEIDVAVGVTPDNSFKPNPLRGSA